MHLEWIAAAEHAGRARRLAETQRRELNETLHKAIRAKANALLMKFERLKSADEGADFDRRYSEASEAL